MKKKSIATDCMYLLLIIAKALWIALCNQFFVKCNQRGSLISSCCRYEAAGRLIFIQRGRREVIADEKPLTLTNPSFFWEVEEIHLEFFQIVDEKRIRQKQKQSMREEETTPRSYVCFFERNK
ncbi:CLUMA_CG001458, isoform A [Clunio marinus]|uniref:CLUMA_CG001458, isoform A n=1 Tax=Clunio marinus TaxID=568069 RepID=A0A1J1HN55_9DIPT|nr:CLUMA_CG001458, isoform A [Clunio marinus]